VVRPHEPFFGTLYKDQTGVLELRAFAPSGDTPEVERQRRAANMLRDFITVENGLYDVMRVERFLRGCEDAKLGAFFGVALRTRSAQKERKGDAAHCQTLTTLFVDADFKHLGEEETRRRIREFPLPVSMLVCSGGGLHPYYLKSSPIYLQRPGALQRARLQLRRLAKCVADVVDESVSEPVRVLRIPGSYNFKKEYGEPRLVALEIGPDAVAPGWEALAP
jgi:hypothetical protein